MFEIFRFIGKDTGTPYMEAVFSRDRDQLETAWDVNKIYDRVRQRSSAAAAEVLLVQVVSLEDHVPIDAPIDYVENDPEFIAELEQRIAQSIPGEGLVLDDASIEELFITEETLAEEEGRNDPPLPFLP